MLLWGLMCITHLQHDADWPHLSAPYRVQVAAAALGTAALDSLQVSLVPFLFPLSLGLRMCIPLLYLQSLSQDPNSFPSVSVIQHRIAFRNCLWLSVMTFVTPSPVGECLWGGFSDVCLSLSRLLNESTTYHMK